MDNVEQRMTDMDIKLDGLYEAVERLTIQLTLLLAERSAVSVAHQYSTNSLVVSPFGLINHQDVLIDDAGENLNSINQDPIEPEVQIKRLTAQLTAAYNRIASLEEQLMQRRSNNNRNF